ncbi:hypothetical protein DXT63_14705 [Thermoanaerobacteraceae bacterium SP2]|nr:hypothetical protein DXT63_14705 [Thermoanaerobacteraceae bacterium SP2]
MRAQLTITVDAAKWLIARAIVRLPEVQEAYRNGKILLKGGTTVSCIAEELLGINLRISGRITKRGTVGSFENTDSPHSVLIKNGQWQNIDDHFSNEVLEMESEDVIIIGANAIDADGNAAMMAGSPGGGNPGTAFAALNTEGAHVIIAAGLEKLIPGEIADIIRKASRKNCDFAMGMAVGLIPIYGRLITEVEALKIISNTDVIVIGRGGINGGEGSTTVILDGDEDSLKKAIKAVLNTSQKPISGTKRSLKECTPGSPGCTYHLSCFYSHKNKIKI